jgi:hypothetical protein
MVRYDVIFNNAASTPIPKDTALILSPEVELCFGKEDNDVIACVAKY